MHLISGSRCEVSDMSFIKKIFKGRFERRNSDTAAINGCDGIASPSSTGCRSASSSPASSPSRRPSSYTTRVGVRAPSNPHVAQVLPGLLLGSHDFAQDLSGLLRYKVTHVLNITSEVANSFPDRFTYNRIAIPDLPSIKIVQYFDDVFRIITSCRQNGGCILVHCYYGNSRAASFVLGYLMRTEHMRYREALEYLRLIRPDVSPNEGFERQLKVYELENCR